MHNQAYMTKAAVRSQLSTWVIPGGDHYVTTTGPLESCHSTACKIVTGSINGVWT